MKKILEHQHYQLEIFPPYDQLETTLKLISKINFDISNEIDKIPTNENIDFKSDAGDRIFIGKNYIIAI